EKQRLGRRDQDVRRALHHRLALGRRRIAGAYERAELYVGKPHRLEPRSNPGDRLREVLLNVVRERLERRDVYHLDLVQQRSVQPLPEQRVDRGEEGGESLARAGGRRDEGVATRLDDRPGSLLRLGRLTESRVEPA